MKHKYIKQKQIVEESDEEIIFRLSDDSLISKSIWYFYYNQCSMSINNLKTSNDTYKFAINSSKRNEFTLKNKILYVWVDKLSKEITNLELYNKIEW